MESELIIDGQAVDLSETQETAEEVTTQQQKPEHESTTHAEANEPEKPEIEQPNEPPEDYSLRIGDEEISLSEEDEQIDGQPAPQWVKDLRKGFKEQQKENRELRRQLEEQQSKPQEQQASQQEAIPPKPSLDSCDWDEERYDRELTEWHEKKNRVEQQQQQSQRQQKEIQDRYDQRLKAHNERAAKFPAKDYLEVEAIARNELPQMQQSVLIHAADEGTELIAYALGKNEKLRQRVAAETDPIRAAFLLGQISKQVSLAPKPKSTSKPEPVVKGGGADTRQDEFNKLCPGAIIN